MPVFPDAWTSEAVLRLGAWLHPATSHRPGSEAERRVQRRAGVVGGLALGTGGVAVALAVAAILVGGVDPVPQDRRLGEILMPAAVLLVIISVFAPQSIFRTQSAARTRQVLTSPSEPLPPWQSSTLVFDAVLVGALLAGIYITGVLALAMFGLALVIRTIVQSSRHLPSDPNARFHAVMAAWSAGVTGAAAFLVVRPLVPSIDDPAPLWPLLFAALLAMYVGLALNSLLRWVSVDRSRWAFARDSVDPRRLVVALVSALITWLVSWTGVTIDALTTPPDPATGTLSALAVFVGAWLVLWFASIRSWQRDAQRTLDLWSAHQAEITGRLADGSLSPALAARAGLRVTTRMAISVFGATRAMTVVSHPRQEMSTDLVAVDRYAEAPTPDVRSIAHLPQLRMPLYPLPGHPSTSSVTVAGWLWPGWFVTRSRSIVQRFTDLATQTLLVPVVASEDSRMSEAFEEMFTPISRWPSLTAFEEAVQRMREQTDASPQSSSLLVAVYAIDEFGALAGGKFEQSAVGQVMRLALGTPEFAGHDAFVAYEHPGRIWVALRGGPIIRTGVNLLRSLQQHINDHGSVPSVKLDVDIHVAVSFGYAAHQVDDFTCAGLMAMARERLAADQAARDPFTIDNVLTLDFSPEDIIATPAASVTATDVVALVRQDRHAQASDGERRFPVTATPLISVSDAHVGGLVVAVGWQRSIGAVDASQPDAFGQLIGRQIELAAEGARVILAEVKSLISATRDGDREDLPVVVWLPSVLVTPDAGTSALPNLVTPFLDRAECARTVILLDTVPPGSGQALRLLADRGVHIAVTAGAAAADPADLLGWRRWAILFPSHVSSGRAGVDGLTIQQTVSAIANQDTRLIAQVEPGIEVDRRELAAARVQWLLDSTSGIEIASADTLRDELL